MKSQRRFVTQKPLRIRFKGETIAYIAKNQYFAVKLVPQSEILGVETYTIDMFGGSPTISSRELDRFVDDDTIRELP